MELRGVVPRCGRGEYMHARSRASVTNVFTCLAVNVISSALVSTTQWPAAAYGYRLMLRDAVPLVHKAGCMHAHSIEFCTHILIIFIFAEADRKVLRNFYKGFYLRSLSCCGTSLFLAPRIQNFWTLMRALSVIVTNFWAGHLRHRTNAEKQNRKMLSDVIFCILHVSYLKTWSVATCNKKPARFAHHLDRKKSAMNLR